METAPRPFLSLKDFCTAALVVDSSLAFVPFVAFSCTCKQIPSPLVK